MKGATLAFAFSFFFLLLLLIFDLDSEESRRERRGATWGAAMQQAASCQGTV